jgi:hypothetical protein
MLLEIYTTGQAVMQFRRMSSGASTAVADHGVASSIAALGNINAILNE